MSATHHDAGAGHRALVYDDATGFVDGVAAFVRAGLRAAERVVVILTPEKLGWLGEELGRDADALDVAEVRGFYERPGPMFRSILDMLAAHRAPGGRRVRLVAEQALALREPVDVRAYMRYEAASNLAYSGAEAAVLCPYDAQRLPAEILDAALRTHPEVVENGRARPSERFMDPREFVRLSAHDRVVPAEAPACPLDAIEDVAGARALVRAQALAAGLPAPAVEDFMLAVSELAANALLHGNAPRRLWSFRENDRLVCRVTDAGSGFSDPLAGYFPPQSDRLSGRGLWLAHQLCDVVEVARDATGTSVILHMRLPASA